MGELIEVPSNGSTVSGYLAVPDAGTGPGVVVIQEWWGLVDHIKDVCDRFADEGFVALAPDLYHGETTTEPDEAGKLMMALNLERAARDLIGAVQSLNERDETTGGGVGVVGFCMGGGLALWLATLVPERVAAAVPFYGVIPWEAAQPDYSQLRAAVQGHYGTADGFVSVDDVRSLEHRLKDLGKDVEFHLYEDQDHAFFNDTRPDAYDADSANQAWERTLSFLRSRIA